MLTRRELLLSMGAFGLPLAVAAKGGTRFGVLQSRAPFIDINDVRGSRSRAFAAFRALLTRSVAQQGRLDWLFAGALPLSGSRAAVPPDQLALDERREEVRWLAAFAREQQLNLALGAWWRAAGNPVQPRLLEFDNEGRLRVQALHASGEVAGVCVERPQRLEARRDGLAAMCRARRSFGVRVVTPGGPLAPPGAVPANDLCSCIVAPDGAVLAAAEPQAEACLVATV